MEVNSVIRLMLVGVAIIGYGLVAITSPRTAWYFVEGWKFKNAEPSGCALVFIRVSGVWGVIVGIAFIVMAQMFAG